MLKHTNSRRPSHLQRVLAILICLSLVLQSIAPAVVMAEPPPPRADGPAVVPPLLTERVYLPLLAGGSGEEPTEPAPESEFLNGALSREPTSRHAVDAVVDDWDGGFSSGGHSAYWWNHHDHRGIADFSSWGACPGHGEDAHLTFTNYGPGGNWGRWTPTLSQAGRYKVYAHIPLVKTRTYYNTFGARYKIHHKHGVTERVVKQEGSWCYWIELGEYSFDAGYNEDRGSLYLDNYTYHDSYYWRTVVFDAVKFVLVKPSYPKPAPTPPPPVEYDEPSPPLPEPVKERTPEYLSRRSWDTEGPEEELRVGQVIPVEFRIVNDGDLAWHKTADTDHNPVYLGTSNARDRNSPMHDPNDNRWLNAKRIKLVQDVVQPGETAKFQFNLLTHAVGKHVECFELVADAVNSNLPHGWFGTQICWKVEVRADTPPKPQLSSHLRLSPASPVQGETVEATFEVCNDGETAKNLDNLLVKVWKGSNDGAAADFPNLSVGSLAGGQCRAYDKTLSGGWSAGDYKALAGYNDGSWHALATREGVANEQEFTVLTPADVKLKDGTRLELDPNSVWEGGEPVEATFTAKNYGQATTSEKLRAIVSDGQPAFGETGSLSFGGGAEHSYQRSRSFSERGVFWVTAQHLPQGDGWTDLAGEGREVLRIFAPAPLEEVEHKGIREEPGYAGEPVNTSSGNFVSRHRDLLAPAPSMPFVVERTYNAVDADTVLDGPFGYGWVWNYDMTVEWRRDKTANITLEDGHVEYYVGEVLPDDPFRVAGSYVYSGTLNEANDLYRRDDGSFVLTTTEQFVYTFAAQEPTSNSLQEWWRLTQIEDADGHQITIQRDANARVSTVTDGMGRTHTVTSNAQGHITAITTADGRTVSYAYDGAGNLVSFTDAEEGVMQYTYDANHRLLSGQDAEGNFFVENNYDGSNRVVTQVTGRGQTVLRNQRGMVTEVLDDPGFTSSFTYETTAQYLERKGVNLAATTRRALQALNAESATTYTNPEGQETTHFHNSEGHLVMASDPLDESVSYTYDENNRVIAESDRNGNTTSYSYDEQGNRLTKTDALGNLWRYSYDKRNNMLSETDPLGNTTLYDYDEQNRLIRVADPLGFTRVYRYNDDGLPIAEWDEDGNATYTAYNALGLPIAITETVKVGDGEANSVITRKNYDERGNLLSVTDPEGRMVNYTYNDLDQLTSMTDPRGTLIEYTYDGIGNLISETDGMGNVKSYSYNASGWLVSETDFEGHTYSYDYDAAGRRIATIDALGHTMTNTYDIAGHLIAQKDQRGFITRYAYDANGNLIQETDALGNITTHTYDALNRRIATTRPCPCDSPPLTPPNSGRGTLNSPWGTLNPPSPNSSPPELGGIEGGRRGGRGVRAKASTVTESWVYDDAGRLIEEIDAAGNVTRHTYDAKGRRIASTDALGNRTQYEYDRANRLIHLIDPLGEVTSYVYNALGERIKTYDPLGNLVQDEQYDLVGNREAQFDANGEKTRYEYDDNDRLVRVFDPLDQRTAMGYDDRGNLTSQVNPRGFTIRYGYDGNNNRTSFTDAQNHTFNYEYDELNRLSREIDPLQGVTRHLYDEAGNPLQEINALGDSTRHVYDALGRVIEEQNARGHSTHYFYNAAGLLERVVDPLGNQTTYSYDVNGNRISETDALGNVTTIEYDALNRPIRVTDPLGGVSVTEYDAAGRVIARTDRSGATTRYTYDASGRLIATEDAMGHLTSTLYDAKGQPIYTIDQNRNTTSYKYDAVGREEARTNAQGQTSQTMYDTMGNITGTIDYRGQLTLMEYDANNNLLRRIDPAGGVTSFSYDELNRKIAQTDPEGQTTHYGYDAIGNLITVTLPAGQVTTYQYDANGNQIAMTDAEGNIWTYQYDALNRRTAELNPLGQRTQYEYDALGRRTLIRDPLGNETRYSYDALGRLTKVTDGAGRITRYLYNAAGNLMAYYDPAGNVTRFDYDLLGRRTREIDALGRTWHTNYDPIGNEIATINPQGQVITKTYDLLNRPILISYPDQTVEYAYDANGNRTAMTDTLGVTSYSYDNLNRLTASTDSFGQTVSYSYDSNSQRLSISYPDGNSVSYAYDANGSLQEVSEASGPIHYTRNALGAVTAITYPNGAGISYTYDAAGRLTAQTNHDNNNQPFASYSYVLDANGNRTNMTEVLGSTTLTHNYDYDALGRLTFSFTSDGSQQHYTFDQAGNIAQIQGARINEQGTLEGYAIDYSYNAANQLISATDSVHGSTIYSYDRAGNRIEQENPTRRHSYNYDAANRLTSATVYEATQSGWSELDNRYERYSYDGNGRRVLKSVSDPSDSPLWQRTYRYDDVRQWDVLLETGSASASDDISRYTYGDNRNKLTAHDSNGSSFFHLDGLNSIIGSSDSNGQPTSSQSARYSDYGELLTGSDALNSAWGYTGHENDTYTGLVYAKNRYYDPTSQQWLSADPYRGQPDSPLTQHRYLYVQSNPINNIDPLGLFSWKPSSIVEHMKNSASDVLATKRHIFNANNNAAPPVRSAYNDAQRQATQVHINGMQGAECGQRCNQSYIVRPGDTLSGIAARHGISDWYNGLYLPNQNTIGPNPNRIYSGQGLHLPCGTTPTYRNQPTTPASQQSSSKPIILALLMSTNNSAAQQPNCSHTYPLAPGQTLCNCSYTYPLAPGQTLCGGSSSQPSNSEVTPNPAYLGRWQKTWSSEYIQRVFTGYMIPGTTAGNSIPFSDKFRITIGWFFTGKVGSIWGCMSPIGQSVGVEVVHRRFYSYMPVNTGVRPKYKRDSLLDLQLGEMPDEPPSTKWPPYIGKHNRLGYYVKDITELCNSRWQKSKTCDAR